MKFHRTGAGLMIDCSTAALFWDIFCRHINNMSFDQVAIVIQKGGGRDILIASGLLKQSVDCLSLSEHRAVGQGIEIQFVAGLRRISRTSGQQAGQD